MQIPNASALSVTHFEKKKRMTKQTDTQTDSHARKLIVLTGNQCYNNNIIVT